MTRQAGARPVLRMVAGAAVLLAAAGCSSGEQEHAGHAHPAESASPVSTSAPVPVGSNAKLVTDFYTQAFVHRDVAGASQIYVAESYIQHNPQVPNGRAAFVDTMGPYVKDGVTFRIGRVVAEGDIVVVHAESIEKDGQRSAVADFFRVENGKIVEHWDVIQAIPADTANGNPMVPGTATSQAPGHR